MSLQTVWNNHDKYIRSLKSNFLSDNLKLIIHADRTPQNKHRGRYNSPKINEVAVLLVDEYNGPKGIGLYCKDSQLKRVSELHRAYDSLQYRLMFVWEDYSVHLI